MPEAASGTWTNSRGLYLHDIGQSEQDARASKQSNAGQRTLRHANFRIADCVIVARHFQHIVTFERFKVSVFYRSSSRHDDKSASLVSRMKK